MTGAAGVGEPPQFCEDCGAELVEQRMPTELRWPGVGSGFVPEAEETFLVHRVGTSCVSAS